MQSNGHVTLLIILSRMSVAGKWYLILQNIMVYMIEIGYRYYCIIVL